MKRRVALNLLGCPAGDILDIKGCRFRNKPRQWLEKMLNYDHEDLVFFMKKK